MKQRLILLLPLLLMLPLLFTGCDSIGPTEKKRPPKDRDKDLEYCLKAEKKLEFMQCKDRAGDLMWKGFRQICERIQQGEGGIFLNPKCIANAMSCTEVNQCPAEGMQ